MMNSNSIILPRQLRLATIVFLFSLGLVASPARAGVTLTTLISFAGTNGDTPMGTLVQSADGSFYGVTQSGGISNAGIVFKLTADGTLTTLVSFAKTNGALPHAGLVQGSDGDFYGTTSFGGAFGGASGNGTVFKITPGGLLTTLVSFNGMNGASPAAELVEGADGKFYGTTSDGGLYTNQFLGIGYGTIFRMTPAGALTTLISFNGTNGGAPEAPLTIGADGNFYGNTRLQVGGLATNIFGQGPGTFFSLTPDGTLTTQLSFDGTNSGSSLFGLVPAADGAFYEMCDGEGTNLDSHSFPLGMILRLKPGAAPTTLHAFDGTDGGLPRGLMRATDGNFYGMTGFGGPGYAGYLLTTESQSQGTVFKMTPDGTLSTLVVFTNGEIPFGGLLQASDGNLYGTTRGGGTYGHGTVFRLSVPMPPVLRSLTPTGGVLTANWSVVAGQTYQSQYCTDLSKTNWINLGASAPATNGTMTVSDVVGPDPQRFYRLALLP